MASFFAKWCGHCCCTDVGLHRLPEDLQVICMLSPLKLLISGLNGHHRHGLLPISGGPDAFSLLLYVNLLVAAQL